MKKIIFTYTAFILTVCTATANNITVANASISGQNAVANTEIINFDVAWDNAWRTSTNENNYDGAWIFVKYRKLNTLDWRHCTINTTGSAAAAGATFSIPADGKGAFIYRAANGIGNVNYTANQLVWNYGVDGLLDNETVEIRVFALEMVYVTQGTFQLGSGGSEINVYKTGAGTTAYDITAAAITFGTTGTNLNTNGNGPTTGTLPAAYPTGFNAFWIMKYECSQQQYIDFLNHIDLARANFNDNTGIRSGVHPNYLANQPERAVGNCNSQRLAAMADWSGLRPFTEMEYEKACRGFNTPAVPNEYPWGNTTSIGLNSVSNIGLANETVASPINSNANFGNNYGGNLNRVGLFARSTGSTRAISGGSYYGVMDMGGNTAEIIVNTVNPAGLAFDGSLHGDGYLAATGASDISNWTANFNIYGWKGGNASTATNEMRTSDRAQANGFVAFGSDNILTSNGIRMVRTAP